LITSFGNQATADLFNGINSRDSRKIPSEITRKALNKLDILNAVEKLDDLKSPPGNRLEVYSKRLRNGLLRKD
jgi:proteic killer suppression protein